jgi:hypothetical protein
MTKMTTDPPGKRGSDHDELDAEPVELCGNISNGKYRGFHCSLPKGHAMGTVKQEFGPAIGMPSEIVDHESRESTGNQLYAWSDRNGFDRTYVSILERQNPYAAKEFAGVGRSILIATILTQRTKIASLEKLIKECGDPLCDKVTHDY